MRNLPKKSCKNRAACHSLQMYFVHTCECSLNQKDMDQIIPQEVSQFVIQQEVNHLRDSL